MAIVDGGYKLEALPGPKVSYLLPAPGSISANHVVIEVDAVHAGRHCLYGVFCKADADFANAYTFVIDSTGSWAVGKIRDARLEVLGTGTERWCSRLGTAFSGPSQSIPGLYLESDFERDTKILFDNFIFWGVDPDELTE